MAQRNTVGHFNWLCTKTGPSKTFKLNIKQGNKDECAEHRFGAAEMEVS